MEILRVEQLIIHEGNRYLRMSTHDDGHEHVIWGKDAIGYYTTLSETDKDILESEYSKLITSNKDTDE